jgi:phage/plasmid-associated DNA primase
VELSGSAQKNKIVETLKSIIGEDEVSINEKHKAMFSARLKTRFIVATNALPRLMDASGALAHRLLFLPFEVTFAGREDTALEQKIEAELPGIANWCSVGLRRLRANGVFTLPSAHHRMATQFAASTTPVLSFVKSELIVWEKINPGDLDHTAPDCPQVKKADLYKRYATWSAKMDLEEKGDVWFARDLRAVLPKLTDSQRASGERVWVGVGLRA